MRSLLRATLLRGVIVLIVLMSSSAARAARVETRSYATETEHYRIHTDVSPEFAKLVGEHMEEIYEAYISRFRGFKIRRHGRFDVKVFTRKADYEAAVPPELQGSTGAFVSRDRLLAAYKGGRTDEVVFRTLYHEGFHQFMFTGIVRNPPLWVNEGMAEYFAEATWNGRSFSTGRVPARRLNTMRKALRRREHIPLANLFAMEDGAWLANVRAGQTEVSLQYTEAWSVVHFLIHADGGSYRPRLLTYLRLLGDGTDRMRAFQESFGAGTAGLERAWTAYVMRLKVDPDDVCRRNLEALAHLAKLIHKDPRRFRSLVYLKSRLRDSRSEWYVESSDGHRITSGRPGEVMGLFCCPRAKDRLAMSYLALKDPKTGLLLLACTKHRGVVMLARYVSKPDGTYVVGVEQVVRATLSTPLKMALMDAEQNPGR
ncbi:MAG: DUF1570 domain-containing protein [Candidatus Brocadiia bacterium]|nr:DUF1570 domain-containing protein [Candidatus Brocadiia bacterium]